MPGCHPCRRIGKCIRYRARICLRSDRLFLGRFSSDREAACAWDAACWMLYHNRGRLNFPNTPDMQLEENKSLLSQRVLEQLAQMAKQRRGHHGSATSSALPGPSLDHLCGELSWSTDESSRGMATGNDAATAAVEHGQGNSRPCGILLHLFPPALGMASDVPKASCLPASSCAPSPSSCLPASSCAPSPSSCLPASSCAPSPSTFHMGEEHDSGLNRYFTQTMPCMSQQQDCRGLLPGNHFLIDSGNSTVLGGLQPERGSDSTVLRDQLQVALHVLDLMCMLAKV
jgi:hypothetical protein